MFYQYIYIQGSRTRLTNNGLFCNLVYIWQFLQHLINQTNQRNIFVFINWILLIPITSSLSWYLFRVVIAYLMVWLLRGYHVFTTRQPTCRLMRISGHEKGLKRLWHHLFLDNSLIPQLDWLWKTYIYVQSLFEQYYMPYGVTAIDTFSGAKPSSSDELALCIWPIGAVTRPWQILMFYEQLLGLVGINTICGRPLNFTYLIRQDQTHSKWPVLHGANHKLSQHTIQVQISD